MGKKKKKMSKTRNWIAVNAWERTGAGPHSTKKSYRRSKLSKEEIQELIDEEKDADEEMVFSNED